MVARKKKTATEKMDSLSRHGSYVVVDTVGTVFKLLMIELAFTGFEEGCVDTGLEDGVEPIIWQVHRYLDTYICAAPAGRVCFRLYRVRHDGGRHCDRLELYLPGMSPVYPLPWPWKTSQDHAMR